MDKEIKYNTDINILGSIPDYNLITESLIAEFKKQDSNLGNFVFRTANTMPRFQAAIKNNFFQFAGIEHKSLFIKAITDETLSSDSKLLVLFWQLLYSNDLFNQITNEVFFRFFYSGRVTIAREDVLIYIKYLKEDSSSLQEWSIKTTEVVASKYLTVLKKFSLVDGKVKKEINHPYLEDALFIYFIRLIMLLHPGKKILQNPYIQTGFMDISMILNRLKKIENLAYWDINQIGNDINLELRNI
jgi:hypothetical protein